MKPLIPLQKSVVVACDVGSLRELSDLVRSTVDVDGIGGYKIGFRLAIRDLEKAVAAVKLYGEKPKPVIFDGQKFGNDIPEIGAAFASDLRSCGVDAVIIFPFAGPVTQRAWTEACMKEGLTVIIGGEMTHDGFLNSQNWGYIRDSAPHDIYTLAVNMGVRDFVVPGKKPDAVSNYRKLIERSCTATKDKKFRLYAPGLIRQGGVITEVGKVAGDSWHAIIGGAIYDAGNVDAMHVAAEKAVSQIRMPVRAAT